MTQLRGNSPRRVQLCTGRTGSDVRVQKDQIHCPLCGTRTGLTSTGRVRSHKSPAGDRCSYRAVHQSKVDLETLPPVVLPPPNPGREIREKQPSAPRVRDREPSRLDAGSHCQDCGRWLPGERSLCGRCANHRAEDRR